MKNEVDDSPTNIKPKRDKMAIASLVLGILSIITFPFGGFLLGIIAINFGINSIRKIRTEQGALSGRGLAIAGIITGSLSLIAVVLTFIFVLIAQGEPGAALALFGTVVIVATVVAVFRIGRLIDESPANVFIGSLVVGVGAHTLFKLTGGENNAIGAAILCGMAVLILWGFIALGAIKLYRKRSNKRSKGEQAEVQAR